MNHQFQTGLPGTEIRMGSDFQNNNLNFLARTGPGVPFFVWNWNWSHSNFFLKNQDGRFLEIKNRPTLLSTHSSSHCSWISRSITLIDDHQSSLQLLLLIISNNRSLKLYRCPLTLHPASGHNYTLVRL